MPANVPTPAHAPRQMGARGTCLWPSRHRATVTDYLAGRAVIALAALFDADVRELRETLHQFERPWVVDASRWTATLGPLDVTPHEAAMRRTVEARI